MSTDCSLPRLAKPRLLTAMLGAFFVLGLQITFLVLASPDGTISSAYESCFRKDNVWYGSIVNQGYVSTIPPVPQQKELANVAFFPAYPLMARAVKILLGVPTPVALVLTAQLAAFGIWVYILLLLQRWGLSLSGSTLTVLLIVAHPDSFYLVVGYSESLFLTAVLGFLYWLGSSKKKAELAAALHGFVLSATRPVGILLPLWPIISSLLFAEWRTVYSAHQSKPNLSLAKPVLITLFSSLGCILFFAFCAWKFGAWDLYKQTQSIGWGHRTNFFAFFYPSTYSLWLPDQFWQPSQETSRALGLLVITLTLTGYYGLVCSEVFFFRTLKDGANTRWGFYFCGLMVSYLAVSGTYEQGMNAILRYSLPSYVLFVLSAAHVANKLPIRRLNSFLCYALLVIISCLILAGILIQFKYTVGFLRGIKIS